MNDRAEDRFVARKQSNSSPTHLTWIVEQWSLFAG
jgi:hypothetical protein